MRRAAGFTLIEVLIASLILFAAVSVATLAYRGALNALGRVDRQAEFMLALPHIQEIIAVAMDQGAAASGDGSWADLQYEWQADVVSEAVTDQGMDVDTGLRQPGLFQLRLHDIEVRLRTSQAADRGKRYSYRRITWQPR